jgi:hypothetical protein
MEKRESQQKKHLNNCRFFDKKKQQLLRQIKCLGFIDCNRL